MPFATPQKIVPMLWFDSNAEEAARFYTSIFPGSRIGAITRYAEGGMRPAGSVMTIEFELAGQLFTGLNGGPHFRFSEAVSFVIACDSQPEIDFYWEKLTGNGGQAVQCGWLRDRFGLSWQVTPSILPELLNGPNGGRVMQALMQMVKLDLASLQAAAAG
jgi:predicted 3-demethylubiquinone-9 3-methyltransferase (glyoxalase superfamily)